MLPYVCNRNPCMRSKQRAVRPILGTLSCCATSFNPESPTSPPVKIPFCSLWEPSVYLDQVHLCNTLHVEMLSDNSWPQSTFLMHFERAAEGISQGKSLSQKGHGHFERQSSWILLHLASFPFYWTPTGCQDGSLLLTHTLPFVIASSTRLTKRILCFALAESYSELGKTARHCCVVGKDFRNEGWEVQDKFYIVSPVGDRNKAPSVTSFNLMSAR